MNTTVITTETRSPALVAAYIRLEQASKAIRAAQTELVRATLAALLKQVPASFPDAAAVIFEWSDQGDWLTIARLEDAAGNPIEHDSWSIEGEELADLAVNLEAANATEWTPFTVTLNPDGTDRTRENTTEGAESYRLTLADATQRLAAPSVRTTGQR